MDDQLSIFSLKSRTQAWADKLGRQILGHLGYFRPNYQQPLWYSEFLVHAFHYSTIISTKVIRIPNICLGLGFDLGRKELGIQPSCVCSPCNFVIIKLFLDWSLMILFLFLLIFLLKYLINFQFMSKQLVLILSHKKNKMYCPFFHLLEF